MATRIKIMATMLRGLTQDAFATVLQSDADEVFRDLDMRKRFGKIKELFGEGDWAEKPCPPMEPDIVGEYYVLKHLTDQRYEEDRVALFEAAWKRDETEMDFFVRRLHQDHEAMYQVLLHEMLLSQAQGNEADKKEWIHWDDEKKRTIVDFAGHRWLALDVRKGKALLLTEEVVEVREYHKHYRDISWKKCDLRKYLKKKFYLAYFPDKQDRDRILETENKNADNPTYGTPGGESTRDNVFLLSIEEARRYFENDTARIAKYKDKPWAWWWLRSPGSSSYYAAGVLNVGYVLDIGYHVHFASGGVRPALWLNLKS
jgi:hypothetical protein